MKLHKQGAGKLTIRRMVSIYLRVIVKELEDDTENFWVKGKTIVFRRFWCDEIRSGLIKLEQVRYHFWVLFCEDSSCQLPKKLDVFCKSQQYALKHGFAGIHKDGYIEVTEKGRFIAKYLTDDLIRPNKFTITTFK